MTQHDDSLIDKAKRALGMDVDEADMHRSRSGAVADEAARRHERADEATGSAGEDAEDAWEHERRTSSMERRR